MNFTPEEWREKYLAEYARQAASACADVLLVNSLSASPDEAAFGGCCRFLNGNVEDLLPPGEEGLLLVEV